MARVAAAAGVPQAMQATPQVAPDAATPSSATTIAIGASAYQGAAAFRRRATCNSIRSRPAAAIVAQTMYRPVESWLSSVATKAAAIPPAVRVAAMSDMESW